MIFLLFILSAWGFELNISGVQDIEIQASKHLFGKTAEIPLQKHGDLWVGEVETNKARYVPITIKGSADEVYFQGLVPTYRNDKQIWLDIDQDHNRARLLSQAGPATAVEQAEQQWIYLRIIWFLIALLAVGTLFYIQPTGPPLVIPKIPSWGYLCFWIFLSVLWNGPALWGEGIPGVHHDAPGTFWFLSASGQWNALFDPHTEYPTGADYGQLDSYLLLVLARLGPPTVIYKCLLLLGPALSGWAAQHFAQAVGAKQPWSVLAGLSYIFSGLAATAALEGHVYQLMQPWLPICCWMWWKANAPTGRPIHGLLTGLSFLLCLVTSAYIGVCAAMAVIIIWISNSGWRHRATWYALLVVLPGVLVFLSHLLGTETLVREKSSRALLIGSANPANMFGHTPELDRAGHSQTLGLLAIPFALAVIGKVGNKTLWLVVLISFVLSLGPYFSINSADPLFPLPFLLLKQLPLLDSLSFPIRMGWPLLLCIGVLGSLALSQQKGSIRMVVLGLALVEAVISPMLFNRQNNYDLETPSVLQQSDGPILNLYPQLLPHTKGDDPELQFTAFACIGQKEHQQPIAENCMATAADTQPRRQIVNWVMPRIMSGEWQLVKKSLEDIGFGSIAFFPDLYTEGDRYRLQKVLKQMDPTPKESIDGGFYVQLYQLQKTTKKTPLPQDTTTRKWGTPTGVSAKSLQIDFMPDERQRKERFSLVIGQQKYAFQKVDPGQQLRASVSAMFVGETFLQIVNEHDTEVWSGSFIPATKHERISIVENFVAAAPIQDSPGAFAPNGKIALFGWLFIGGVIFGIRSGLTHHHRKTPQSAS